MFGSSEIVGALAAPTFLADHQVCGHQSGIESRVDGISQRGRYETFVFASARRAAMALRSFRRCPTKPTCVNQQLAILGTSRIQTASIKLDRQLSAKRGRIYRCLLAG